MSPSGGVPLRGSLGAVGRRRDGDNDQRDEGFCQNRGMTALPRTVSVAFVRSAVAALAPALRARVLAEAGIAASVLDRSAARVPASAFAALWMAVARELDDEFFGLDARRMKVGSFAQLCRAAATQSTFERALQQALRGFALFLDDIVAVLRPAGREARIEIDNRIGGSGGGAAAADARRFADETLLVMVHGVMCWLAGRRVPLARLEWAHPRPVHADEYLRMFSPDLRFGRDVSAIVFDARLLKAQVSVSATSLRVFLRDAPQSVFLKQVAAGGWSERVRRRLRDALAADDAATLQRVAVHLAVSPATLRRRLDDEGSSWRQLKDETRRELAIRHLADPHQSIERVAQRLGFNDASSFHRAFRKWTGAAPGAYRAAAKHPSVQGRAR